jgi:hypothetical protein
MMSGLTTSVAVERSLVSRNLSPTRGDTWCARRASHNEVLLPALAGYPVLSYLTRVLYTSSDGQDQHAAVVDVHTMYMV